MDQKTQNTKKINTVPRNLGYLLKGDVQFFYFIQCLEYQISSLLRPHGLPARIFKLIDTERIMWYHHVSWLSISVKPKNMKETTLVLRVCVYMTARS